MKAQLSTTFTTFFNLPFGLPFSLPFSFLFTALLTLAGCGTDRETAMPEIQPPIAKRIPKTLNTHGHDRQDPYYWMRDDKRINPEVISLLEAENAYTKAVMAHTEPLQSQLFAEITGRLVVDDSTVPVKDGNYFYHREFKAGGEYPLYLRRHIKSEQSEVLLDVNVLAKGHDFFQVGNWSVSQDEQFLAYVSDILSRRVYTIQIKNLKTGELLPDKIPGASTSLAWANDNKTLFYVQKHPETLLPYRVMRHQLGQPIESDQLVFEQSDQRFYTSVATSRSKQYVIISTQSTDSSEIMLLDANQPQGNYRVVLPAEPEHEYRVRHVGNELYIVTNWLAENFRLMKVADDHLGDKTLWEEVVPHQPDTLLEDVEVFTRHIVLQEQSDALPRIRVMDLDTGNEQVIVFPDAAYTARLHTNPEVDSNVLRYVYSSMSRPSSVFEYDMDKHTSTLLKQDKVEGEFDENLYQADRLKIKARDGTLVPVSLVYRKDKFRHGENPLYQYAYGAYGYSTPPSFSSLRLSLLDRGFVYAIVHVRGGSEMGRSWYEQGKLNSKWNTFNDFMDATDALKQQGYAHPDKVFASGGSAGGLLMGVIANEAPEKYLAIIASVPFVDAVTTMLDESIPLTTGEFSEWGNPMDQASYQYIHSYSPYDQVKAQLYPHMLVTAGFHDSQVQYFEPAKWVAKLRHQKQGNRQLLFHVNMEAGHGGNSARYARYREDALEYAFILDLLK